MQDPTTTTSNFGGSSAILILKEATNRKPHRSIRDSREVGEETRLLLYFVHRT